jgi:[amino group carrier protein]-L-2-aminoadipate 6-kinase
MIHVLKLGGGAGIDHAAAIHNLADRVRSGERWVIVHGASNAANTLSEQLGHPARTLTSPGGHTSRYTDARTLEIYGMAVGSVNQSISAKLSHLGIDSVGLGGPSIITGQRKSTIRALVDGKQVVIRDDYSGKITGINANILRTLLYAGCTPVVGPLALGTEGERLNVDGDLAAASIANALNAQTLIILSNVPGLLRDVSTPTSLITRIEHSNLSDMEQFAQGRMKKKLLAAQEANVRLCILSDARIERPLDYALQGGGTHILSRELINA